MFGGEIIKNRADSDKEFKKKIVIMFEGALLITIILLIVLVVNSDDFSDDSNNVIYVTTTRMQTDASQDTGSGAQATQNNGSSKPSAEGGAINNSGDSNQVTININNNGGVNIGSGAVNQQNNSGASLPEPSGWSKAEIISKATDAVNKTKSYNGSLTVNHSENFTANVTECSGGGIVKSVVDLMIGWVVSPVSETLSYQNGRATNSEGESVPIILPIKNAFTLSENGVSNASVKREGNEYVITLKLVEEKVGMYQVPTHNAASIGYLDVANFDISFMEVDKANIIYKGSSIVLRVNADGYVTYASYEIPLHIDGAAHKGSISGTATFEGSQTEEWILNW